MTAFELMILADKLGDCIAFVSRIHRAVFWTKAAARRFQEAAPGWTVRTWGECMFYGI